MRIRPDNLDVDSAAKTFTSLTGQPAPRGTLAEILKAYRPTSDVAGRIERLTQKLQEAQNGYDDHADLCRKQAEQIRELTAKGILESERAATLEADNKTLAAELEAAEKHVKVLQDANESLSKSLQVSSARLEAAEAGHRVAQLSLYPNLKQTIHAVRMLAQAVGVGQSQRLHISKEVLDNLKPLP